MFDGRCGAVKCLWRGIVYNFMDKRCVMGELVKRGQGSGGKKKVILEVKKDFKDDFQFSSLLLNAREKV